MKNLNLKLTQIIITLATSLQLNIVFAAPCPISTITVDNKTSKFSFCLPQSNNQELYKQLNELNKRVTKLELTETQKEDFKRISTNFNLMDKKLNALILQSEKTNESIKKSEEFQKNILEKYNEIISKIPSDNCQALEKAADESTKVVRKLSQNNANTSEKYDPELIKAISTLNFDRVNEIMGSLNRIEGGVNRTEGKVDETLKEVKRINNQEQFKTMYPVELRNFDSSLALLISIKGQKNCSAILNDSQQFKNSAIEFANNGQYLDAVELLRGKKNNIDTVIRQLQTEEKDNMKFIGEYDTEVNNTKSAMKTYEKFIAKYKEERRLMGLQVDADSKAREDYRNKATVNYQKEIDDFLVKNPYWKNQFNNFNPSDPKWNPENFTPKGQAEEYNRKVLLNNFIYSIRNQKIQLDSTLKNIDSDSKKNSSYESSPYNLDNARKYKASTENIDLLNNRLTEAKKLKEKEKLFEAVDLLYVTQQEASNKYWDKESPISHKTKQFRYVYDLTYQCK